MKHVLIVEDSNVMAALNSRRILPDLKLERDIATTLKQACDLIEQDAPNGEIIDYVIRKKSLSS